MIRTLRILTAVILTLALAGPVAASSERILDYQSRILVEPDGTLLVTETITANTAGDKIKRGIYRDFPTIYNGPFGTRAVVPFDVFDVKRDGHPEPYHLENRSNGVRVYVGQSDVMLHPGVHTFTIGYRTSHQLGFFDTHDELYWNVTGNGWDFPIDRAAATVTLPAAVPRKQIQLEGYTGPQGSKAHNLTTSIDPETGELHFKTAKPLDAHSGLTIVASFPKGFIRPPSGDERWLAFFSSNAILVAGAAGMVLVLVYYLFAWVFVGRDPSRGTIIPLFEPPLDMPPACVRYLFEMAYDQRCFTSALIDMAVRGFLKIDDNGGTYTLKRLDSSDGKLPLGERRVATQLLDDGSIVLEQTNHTKIKKAISALREALKLEYDGKMFVANRSWMIPGVVLSLLTVAIMALSGSGDQVGVFAFMIVWLTGWTFGVYAVSTMAVRAWWAVLYPSGSALSRVGAVAAAIFSTAFAAPFIAGEGFGLFMLARGTTVWVVPVFLSLIGLSFLFFHLLKRPTLAGRKVMDQIEGFRMYLSTAEGDRFGQAAEPPKTPALFEKMLPYAIALGVEKAWSEKFAEVLAAASRDGTAYNPAWYSGSSWNNLGSTNFASAFGSSLAGAIASSSTAPGSSSGGGGGGSSGGGGGGGGGGGW